MVDGQNLLRTNRSVVPRVAQSQVTESLHSKKDAAGVYRSVENGCQRSQLVPIGADLVHSDAPQRTREESRHPFFKCWHVYPFKHTRRLLFCLGRHGSWQGGSGQSGCLQTWSIWPLSSLQTPEVCIMLGSQQVRISARDSCP